MHAETPLPCDAASVARARRFVGEQLRSWRGTDFDEVAVLLVSELVTNAVLHARTDVTLTMIMTGDRLRIEVIDTSPRLPAMRRHGLRSATGRGLRMVQQFAASWGVERRATGKAVWFELVDGMAEPEPDLEFFAGLDDDLEELTRMGSSQRGRR